MDVGDGNLSKNEEVTLSGEEPLTAADIDISEMCIRDRCDGRGQASDPYDRAGKSVPF